MERLNATIASTPNHTAAVHIKLLEIETGVGNRLSRCDKRILEVRVVDPDLLSVQVVLYIKVLQLAGELGLEVLGVKISNIGSAGFSTLQAFPK